MVKMKATIILIILCVVPFNPILGVAGAQDTSEEISDITLEYSDEKYTAIRDPTMLPPSLPIFGIQNFHSETFGDIFVSSNRLYSESGDVIEIGGTTNYALRHLTKSFAQFTDLSIFSFESNNYLALSEPVDSNGNYSFQMRNYCSTKWIFFDTCFGGDVDIVLDRYLIVLGSHWEEQDFIIDLKLNTTIYVGSIVFVDTETSGLGYTLFETLNESIDERELIILYPNAAPITIDNYSTWDISYNLPNMCKSKDYIHLHYRDKNANPPSIYKLINTQNLSSIEYSYGGNEYCLEYGGYVLVNQMPYSMNELFELRAHNKQKDTSQFVGVKCQNEMVGSHWQNSVGTYYTQRFIVCYAENAPNFNYFFDTMTGDLLKTYKNHEPSQSNENYILFRNDLNDCLFLDSESNTLIPIIELSDFYCSWPFMHENRLFLAGGIAVIAYSSDGRIDLDDSVTSKEITLDETLASALEDLAESNIFSIFLSIFLLLILVKFRNDSKRAINQLRNDMVEEYASTEDELAIDLRDNTTLPNQNLDAELIRAINLFPDWSRAQIQEHFDNGWSVDQLIEWREDEKNK